MAEKEMLGAGLGTEPLPWEEPIDPKDLPNMDRSAEVTIKFGKGLMEDPFTSKAGKELVEVKIPNRDPSDKSPWESFVVPRNFIHDNKFGKGVWMKLPKNCLHSQKSMLFSKNTVSRMWRVQTAAWTGALTEEVTNTGFLRKTWWYTAIRLSDTFSAAKWSEILSGGAEKVLLAEEHYSEPSFPGTDRDTDIWFYMVRGDMCKAYCR